MDQFTLTTCQVQPSFVSFDGPPIQGTFEAPSFDDSNNETPGTVFLDPHRQEFSTDASNDQKMTALHPSQTPSDALSYDDLDQDEPEQFEQLGLNICDEDENIAPSLPFFPLESMSSNMSNFSPTAISLPVLPQLANVASNECISAVPQFANVASNVSVSSDAMVEVCQLQNQNYLQLAESLSSIILNFQSNLAMQPQYSQYWNLPSITDSNGFILPQYSCCPSVALLKLNEKPGKFGGFKVMDRNLNVESPPVQEKAKVSSPTPAYVKTLAGTVQKLKEIAKKLSVEKRFISDDVRQVCRMNQEKANREKAIRVLESIEESPIKLSTLKIFQPFQKLDERSFMQQMEILHKENIFAFGDIMAAFGYTAYRPMARSTDSEYSVCEKLLNWALRLLIFSAEKMNRAMTLCGADGYQLKFKNRLVKSENWDNLWNGLLKILEANPKLAKNVRFDVKFSQECNKGKQHKYSAHCALKTLAGNFYLHVNEGFEEEFFAKTEELRKKCEIFFVGKENERRNEEMLRKEKANKKRKEKGEPLEPIFKFEARRLYKTASVCKAVKFFQERDILHRDTTVKVKGCKLVKCVIDDLANFKELRENYEGMRSEEEFAQYLCKSATYCGLLAGSEKNTAKLTHKILVTFIVDEPNVPLFKSCLKPFLAEGKLQEKEEFVKSDPGKKKKNPANLFRPCGEENFFLKEDGNLIEHLETVCRIKQFVTEKGISHTEQAELAGGETYLCTNMTLERLEQIKRFEHFTSEYVEATAAKFNTKKKEEGIIGFPEAYVSFSVRLKQGYNPFLHEIEIAGDFKRDVAVQIKDEFFAPADKNQESFCTGCVSCRDYFVPKKKEVKQKGRKNRHGRKNRRNQRKTRKNFISKPIGCAQSPHRTVAARQISGRRRNERVLSYA